MAVSVWAVCIVEPEHRWEALKGRRPKVIWNNLNRKEYRDMISSSLYRNNLNRNWFILFIYWVSYKKWKLILNALRFHIEFLSLFCSFSVVAFHNADTLLTLYLHTFRCLCSTVHYVVSFVRSILIGLLIVSIKRTARAIFTWLGFFTNISLVRIAVAISKQLCWSLPVCANVSVSVCLYVCVCNTHCVCLWVCVCNCICCRHYLYLLCLSSRSQRTERDKVSCVCCNRLKADLIPSNLGLSSSLQSYKEKDVGKVVLYTTSMGIIRDTYGKCANVKQILRTLLIKFEERDVFMSLEYQQEMRDRMQQETIRVPQLFVEGQLIGVSISEIPTYEYVCK